MITSPAGSSIEISPIRTASGAVRAVTCTAPTRRHSSSGSALPWVTASKSSIDAAPVPIDARIASRPQRKRQLAARRGAPRATSKATKSLK
jgi:hypothetical protein